MTMRFSIINSLAFLLGGCLGVAPTEVPLPSIVTADGPSQHDTVVIMLPGRGDRADTFIREGFDSAGERWGFDTIATDAHFGYYMKRSLLPRLHADIVLPAHEAGYDKIWLLGISMGGFGSLLYASEHPELVDGVILLAPFLGDNSSIEEIAASGGLMSWDAESSQLEDYEIRIWQWIGVWIGIREWIRVWISTRVRIWLCTNGFLDVADSNGKDLTARARIC